MPRPGRPPTPSTMSSRSVATRPRTARPTRASVSVSSRCPVPGRWVVYDAASQMVHIFGLAPGATAGGPWTVYVVEPHGNAVFADARLPDGFVPTAWGADFNPDYPSDDRQQLLVFDGAGAQAAIDTGSHAFAWRLPGVIAGALTAALLFLLARILFRRRLVAALVGLFVVFDGMFFVQSRIGMNDVYVGLFIIAAYTVFAAVWTGWWRGRAAFWIGMPVIGLLLGLALASKWVAAYAIGALLLLILVRSALGRVLAILGLIGITGRAGLHGHQRAHRTRSDGPGLRQPDLPRDHDRLHPAGGRRGGAPPDRVDGRGDALRHRRAGRARRPRVLRRAGDRPAGPRDRPRLAVRHAAPDRHRARPGLAGGVGPVRGGWRARIRTAGDAAGRRRPDPPARARPASHRRAGSGRAPSPGSRSPGWRPA